MFKNKELVTAAKVGGAAAVVASMVFCLMSPLTITFIVSKLHINYACTVANSEQGEGDEIVFRTCGFLGHIQPKPVMGQLMYYNLNGHYEFIIAIVFCWLTLYVMLSACIPQYLKSWNLLCDILNSMSRKETLNELQRSLNATWDYQELQIVIIFAEFLMLVFSFVTSCYSEHGQVPFDIALAILSKIIIGRVLCYCLIIGYFVEQLVNFQKFGGKTVELPERVKCLLEKEFQPKMPSDLTLIV